MMVKLNIISIPLFLLLWGEASCQTSTSDELLAIHNLSTIQMNAIVSPPKGSILYNTDEKSIYFYSGTLWKKLRSDGRETKIIAGNNLTITGNGADQTPYIINH